MKKQSVQKGFAILSVSGVVIKFISLLYIPLLLSIIGEVGNGYYQAAAQVFVFAYVLTNSGTLNAITKMTAEHVARDGNLKNAERAFRVSRTALFLIGGAISLLLIIFAQPIANVIRFPEISLSLILIAPSAVITAVVSSYRGYFQGLNNFKPRAVSQVLEQTVNLVASIGLALLAVAIWGTGPKGILFAVAGANAGTTVAAIASLAYLVRYTKLNPPKKLFEEAEFYQVPKHEPLPSSAELRTRIRAEKQQRSQALRLFFRISIPITLAAGLQYAGGIVDIWNTKSRLLAAGFSNDLATQMFGYLAKYQQLIYVPLIIIIGLASTILPNLSGSHAINDTQKFRSSLSYAYRWCFIISIPAATLMAVLSGSIYQTIRLGLGSDLLLFGSAVTIFMSITQVQSSVLQGMNKMYLLAIFLLIGIVTKILVNYWLIAVPFINVNGAIVGSIICYLIPVILNEWYINRQLEAKSGKGMKIMPFIYKPFSASMFMAIVVVLTGFLFTGITNALFGNTGFLGYIGVLLSLLLSLATGGVAFFAAMLFLKGFKKVDMDMLPGKLKKHIPKKIVDGLK